MDWAQFQAGLNQIFIPATVQTGAGKGMIGYQPILPEGAPELPDEIALVSYTDQNAYSELFSTESGKAYQNLHWQYFDRSASHSVVPEPFAGSVEIEHAYDLYPRYAAWMSNSTTVFVFLRANGESSLTFLKRAQEHLSQATRSDPGTGVLDRVALISKDYWIEYVSAVAAFRSEPEADLVIPVENASRDTAKILPGSGINLKF